MKHQLKHLGIYNCVDEYFIFFENEYGKFMTISRTYKTVPVEQRFSVLLDYETIITEIFCE